MSSHKPQLAIFQIGIKAVITRGQRLLMLHRSDMDKWELPGGRINEGEDSYEQTLRRELGEELPGAANIRTGKLLFAHQTDFYVQPNCHLMLLYVRVKAKLSPQPKVSEEHTTARWLTAAEAEALPMNPTHRQAVRRIFQAITPKNRTAK